MADVKSLNDLFVHELGLIYDAEQRLVEALPKLEEAATSSDLKQAFRKHLTETESHVDRVKQLFGLFGEEADAETSAGIKGIIKDGEDAADIDDNAVRDAALIAAAQTAEHFEIAAYGTLRRWAQVIGKKDALQLLDWTLEEEKNADQTLTSIAGRLNFEAATPRAE